MARIQTGRSLRAYDRDLGQAGIRAPMTPGGYITPAAVAQNTCYYGRFVPSRAMSIVTVRVNVTAADAANPIVDVGFCDAALNRLSHTSGTIGFTTTGVKSVAVVQALAAGTVYYVACAIGVTASPGTLAMLNDLAANVNAGSIENAAGAVAGITHHLYAAQGTINATPPAIAAISQSPMWFLGET